MNKILLFFMLLPLTGYAHPGVGIVKDSRGNIYYTDLKQVWKISGGSRKVVVPKAHTHELYIDTNDVLYGEDGYYDPAADKHYHYLWVYRPNGTFDTVMGMKEAYIEQDFSLARDRTGNEYYTRQFLKQPDTTHIYRRTPDGTETVLATGNFKGMKWLHPQRDGSLLFTLHNNVYRMLASGKVVLVKESLASKRPSFGFSGNNIMLWGAWEDNDRNVYVAAFSDQAVKRIDAKGRVTDYYRSKGNWTPLHGVFDHQGRLWVLETSDRNDIRVTLANEAPGATGGRSNTALYVVVALLIPGAWLLYRAVVFRKGAKG